MVMIKTYKELTVWQRSMELVAEIYTVAKSLPKFEVYILASQMIRAAISVPANISEGWARNYRGDFLRFLSISYASALELETHLLICQKEYPDLNYEKSFALLLEVEKMLSSLILKTKSKKSDSISN